MSHKNSINAPASADPPDYLEFLLNTYYPLHFFALFRAHELFNVAPFVHLLSSPVLDIACGDGLIAGLLFRETISYGLDIDYSALQRAAKRHSYQSVLYCDARRTPFSNNSIGGVFSNCALEHIPDMPQLIAEVARILKPGSYFVATCLTPYYYTYNPLFKALNWQLLRGLRQKAIQAENELHNHVSVFDASYYRDQFAKHSMILETQRYYATKPIVNFSYMWDSLSKYPVSQPWNLRHRGFLIDYLHIRYNNRFVDKKKTVSKWHNKLSAICYQNNDANNPGVAQILVARKL